MGESICPIFTGSGLVWDEKAGSGPESNRKYKILLQKNRELTHRPECRNVGE